MIGTTFHQLMLVVYVFAIVLRDFAFSLSLFTGLIPGSTILLLFWLAVVLSLSYTVSSSVLFKLAFLSHNSL
jgi:hypothetical protein